MTIKATITTLTNITGMILDRLGHAVPLSMLSTILLCTNALASWTDCPSDPRQEFQVVYPRKMLKYDSRMLHLKKHVWLVPTKTSSLAINMEKTLLNLSRQLQKGGNQWNQYYKITCELGDNAIEKIERGPFYLNFEDISYNCRDSKGNNFSTSLDFEPWITTTTFMFADKSGNINPYAIFEDGTSYPKDKNNHKSPNYIHCKRVSPEYATLASQVHLSAVHRLYKDSNGRLISELLPNILFFAYSETPILVKKKQVLGAPDF